MPPPQQGQAACEQRRQHALRRKVRSISTGDFMASLLSNTPLPDRASAAVGEEEEDSSCVVCMDDECTHVFVPCGHVCVCATCAEAVMR